MDFKPYKIGKYLLLERIATGGMAEVYRAKASGAGGFEKQLAIKRILPTYSSNEEFRRMFEYEARLCSMLNHANIAQVYDFVKSGETYLLAMEFVDGKNLRQLINKARKLRVDLPIEMSVYMINEVCKALDYAHKKKDDLTGRALNIIHRDMSPQNIMVAYEGAVKIIDFGIAKAKGRVDQTRSGVIKGKFGYMSPEQANGERVSHYTDIFSTTIILYELLTGKRLFAAENDIATLKRIQECIVKRPSLVNPRITEELEKIVLKGLTKDISLRYQSASELHHKLQGYLTRHFPNFSQKNVSDILNRAFAKEMLAEKQRLEEIYRQSIPFSQGAHNVAVNHSGIIEINIDEDPTKSEIEEKTQDTFIEEHPEEEEIADELSDPMAETALANKTESTAAQELIFESPHQADEEKDEDVSIPTIAGLETISTHRKATSPKNANSLLDDQTEPSTQEGLIEPSPEQSAQESLNEQPEDTHTAPDHNKVSPQDTPPPTVSPMGEKSQKTEEKPEPSLQSIPSLKESHRPRHSSAEHIDPEQGFNNTAQSDEGQFTISIERSYQSLKDMGTFGEDPKRDPRSAQRQRPNTSDYSLEDSTSPTNSELVSLREMRPQAKKGKIFSIILIAAGFALIYLYYAFSSMTLPPPSPLVTFPPNNSPITQEREISSRAPKKSVLGYNCSLKIDTDPRNASITVNGEEKGQSPNVIATPCKKGINLSLKLDGYETKKKNIYVTKSIQKVYETMVKIPLGELHLTLSQNASVYVDGRFYGKVTMNEPFIISLRSNKKYALRFENKTIGVASTKQYFIKENSVIRETIVLNIP